MSDKPLKGFARLSPAERSAVSAKGGAALKPEQRPFSNVDLAREAGRLGGLKSRKPKKSAGGYRGADAD